MGQHARGMGTVYRSEGAIASPGHSAETKITVLTSANGKRATKRFCPGGVDSYGKESRWRWREAGISTFDDLARLLAEIERDPLSLIVQGVVAPAWRDKEIIPRRKSKGGDHVLIDGGSRVVHFDIDDLPLPLGTGWHDPEGVARAIWQTVIVARVPAFTDVSFAWQASSSAGTPGKAHLAKLHLWALLDQPIDEDHRKALLKLAGADDSLASVNQPNYTAAPIFDRVPDPLADVGRSGVVIGTLDHACVDQIAWPEAKVKEAKARKPKGEAGPTITPEGLDHATSDAGRAILDSICGKISTAPQGGRNKLINRLAYLIGGHVAGGSIAYAEAREALLKAGLASGHDRYVEAVENGLRDGLQCPIKPQEEAGADVGDQPIEPYHPAPQGDRAAAIAAHPATINAWADQNIPIMQATKAVARAYAEEIDRPEEDDPDRERKQAEIAKAQRAIRRRIRDQFGLDYLPASEITKTAPISRVMLTGAQGVGKTRAVVGADGSPGILHRAQGLVSILFEPDHAMAAQARRDYDANAPEGSAPSIVLRGRPARDPDQPDKPMCHLPDVAGKLAAKGVSVPQALCERCPSAGECGYLRQEKEIKALAAAPEGVAIFAPHDYAFLPLPGLIEPDLAIFDERPRDYGVEEAELSFEMLGEPLQFDRPLTAMSVIQTTSEEADAAAANLQFIRPLMVALRDAGQNHPDRILGALRDQRIDQTHVVGAIAGLTYFQDRETARAMRAATEQYNFAQMSGRPFDLEKRLEAEIDRREGKIARTLKTIFEALLIEIDKPREDAVGIERADVQRRPGSRDRGPGIVAVRTKALRIGRVPFLHLDGTADHRMAQRIFGKMDVAHHPVERSPADRGDRIVQVIGAEFHNAGLRGGRKDRNKITPYHGTWAQTYDAQRADIIKAIEPRPGALIIGNKGAIEALKPGEHGAHAAHFGAIRGRNDWEQIDRIMVIGREEPSPAAVERIARAFAAHDDDAFESLAGKRYPKAQRGIRKRDGSGHGVAVNFHPNAWADRVLKQIRDAEIVQAVDRIRPIFKDQPIEVVLLSPVAVDLTVDQVVAWKDWRKGGTRIERALKQARVVPLSSREAASLLPDIWKGEKTARDDLAAAGLLRQNLNRESYLQFDAIRIGVVATYRAEAEPGKRSHEHKALIAAPPDRARAVLEALTGPLRHFEIVEVIEADPAAAEAAEAREERIAITMHDGGLSEAEAIRVADGLDVPDLPPPKPPDPDREQEAVVVRKVGT